MNNSIGVFVKKLGYLWYFMNPKEHMYEHVSDVPDYYKEATLAFIFVVVSEQACMLYKKGTLSRFNDAITSICQGMLLEICKIPLVGVELLLYTWVYNNWRIATLPWNSTWTWLFSLVAVDFGFYWMHRGTHQISILWTFHEAHHTSEEFNMTVPMRLSIFTSAAMWLTYVPLALAVPPSVFFVHYQINTIYQYWLHSEFIPSLWIFELIFVTPTHHRVHHGRNPRCIDKNFGGFLIIWDKLFGTFEVYENPEEIAFGIVHPLQSFSPITIQTHNLQNMWKRFWEVNGLKNKVSVIFKGPGWSPGKPWLGNIEDIPEPSALEQKYDPKLSLWLRSYAFIHLVALASGYLQFILNLKHIPSNVSLWCSVFIVYSTITFGAIFDDSSHVSIYEIIRCLLYFALDATISCQTMQLEPKTWYSFTIYRYIFAGTFLVWITILLQRISKYSKLKNN